MSAAWFPRNLIESPYQWCLCLSEKDFDKAQKQLKIKKSDRCAWMATEHVDATAHFLESEGKHYAVVCLKDDASRPVNLMLSLLVHEAVHIFQRIRLMMGEDHPSHEFEAYSIQRISQDLMLAYLKSKKKYHGLL